MGANQPQDGLQPVPTGIMQTQPVITVTTITSLASALFAAAVYAFPDLDPNLEKAIIGLIIAAWPVVTAAWTWHRVYAPSSVVKEANKQYLAGKPPTEPQPDTPPPADVP